MHDDQGNAEDLTFERGSGNVFADLGLEHADELLVMADLAIAVNKEIRSRGWTQMEAAKQAGLTRSDVSRLGENEDGWLLSGAPAGCPAPARHEC